MVVVAVMNRVSVFPVLPVLSVRVPLVVWLGIRSAVVLVVVAVWPFVGWVFIEPVGRCVVGGMSPVVAAGGSWGVWCILRLGGRLDGWWRRWVSYIMMLEGRLDGWERRCVSWGFEDVWTLMEFAPFEWGELAYPSSYYLLESLMIRHVVCAGGNCVDGIKR